MRIQTALIRFVNTLIREESSVNAAESNVKVRANTLLQFKVKLRAIDELSVRYTLVRLMNTLVQFCGEHAGSISCLEHWFCSSSNSFPQCSNWMKSFVKARWPIEVSD